MPNLPISSVFDDIPDLDNLCFEYGVEYEGDKIDIPANRYDLLTEKSLYAALQQYRNPKPVDYLKITRKSAYTVTVHPNSIRPYIVCAVIRHVNLKDNFQALLDLQEKLHFNVCRHRTLVAIGVHDLNAVDNNIHYACKAPSDIEFLPLNQTETLNAANVEEYYKEDKHFGKYVPLLTQHDKFPLVYDSKILSLPPVVNGDASKVSQDTTDIFIECTATDLARAHTTLNVLCHACSFWSTNMEIESVDIKYSDATEATPNLSSRPISLSMPRINSFLSLALTPEQVPPLLLKMDMQSEATKHGVLVHIPPQRTDILHPVDVIEDIAIGYSFNKLPRRSDFSMTVAKPQAINSHSDKVRQLMAQLQYSETLGLTLLSFYEANEAMRWQYPSNVPMKPNKHSDVAPYKPVVLKNPSTTEFQQMRTSLLPGLVKFVSHNINHRMPIKVFEVGDCVFLADNPKKSENHRYLAAVYAGKQSGLEGIHGVLNSVMDQLQVTYQCQVPLDALETHCYTIQDYNHPSFFQGRCAAVYYKPRERQVDGLVTKKQSSDVRRIGVFGIVHPEVLMAFKVGVVMSAFELDIEVLQ